MSECQNAVYVDRVLCSVFSVMIPVIYFVDYSDNGKKLFEYNIHVVKEKLTYHLLVVDAKNRKLQSR